MCIVCRRFVYDTGRVVESGCLPRGCRPSLSTVYVEEARVEPVTEEEDGYCLVKKPWRLVLPGRACRVIEEMLGGRMPRLLALGPPGTGKSMFLRIVEASAPATVYRAEPETMISKWIGETEQRFSSLLDKAESSEPSVLIVDEADKLIQPRREGGPDGYSTVSTNIVNMFLRRLQQWSWADRNIGVVMASNKSLKTIESALVRGERLDTLYFPPPSPRAVELLAGLYGRTLSPEEVTTLVSRAATFPNIVEYIKTGELKPYMPKPWIKIYSADCSKVRARKRLRRGDKLVLPLPPPLAFKAASVLACCYEEGPRSLVALLNPLMLEDAVALAESMDMPLAVPFDPRISSVLIFEAAEVPVVLVGSNWPLAYPRIDMSAIAGYVGGERFAAAAMGVRTWSEEALLTQQS